MRFPVSEDAASASPSRSEVSAAGVSAAESSLRGAGRVNLLLLPALGVDEPTRWWVWGWTCLEYYAHSRGHAALQRAAKAFPADERLREEAAKHAEAEAEAETEAEAPAAA